MKGSIFLGISYQLKLSGTAEASGFSFFVSDGLHQIGPEWFTIECPEEFKIAMETNGPLVVPPGKFPVALGPDLLKVQIPDVSSQALRHWI